MISTGKRKVLEWHYPVVARALCDNVSDDSVFSYYNSDGALIMVELRRDVMLKENGSRTDKAIDISLAIEESECDADDIEAFEEAIMMLRDFDSLEIIA